MKVTSNKVETEWHTCNNKSYLFKYLSKKTCSDQKLYMKFLKHTQCYAFDLEWAI